MIKRVPVNGENIYDSHNYNLNKIYSDNLAFDRYSKMDINLYDGLVPNYFNKYKESIKEATRFKYDYLKSKIPIEQLNDPIVEPFSVSQYNYKYLWILILFFLFVVIS